ncbi:hypothetical protein FB45DRAFT_1119947, partial [Roridomyces roridus]
SSEALTVAKSTAEFIEFSTIYFSLSVATSLTTTLLIMMRLLLVQRANKTLDSGLNQQSLNPVIELLVESAVLYSATLLTFVALAARKSLAAFYAQNIHAQMAGFAPLLILFRVSAGYSRSEEEW